MDWWVVGGLFEELMRDCVYKLYDCDLLLWSCLITNTSRTELMNVGYSLSSMLPDKISTIQEYVSVSLNFGISGSN